MFSARRPRWFISAIKTIIVSLTVPLLSAMPVFLPQYAQAATAGSGLCQQTVGSNTGVEVTQIGNDCIVKFTVSAQTTSLSTTWTSPLYLANVRYLIVGGGASGDRGTCGTYWGHGGGGGQVLDSSTTVTPNTSYTITVGKGGVAGLACSNGSTPGGNDGVASSISTIATANPGLKSPSATGATSARGGTSGSGKVGGLPNTNLGGGAGGGAGGDATTHVNGAASYVGLDGGIGIISNITGSDRMYGGGGAGKNDAVFGKSYLLNGVLTQSTGQAPEDNSGQGGSDYTFTTSATAGAAGLVVIRYQAIFTTTFNVNGGSGSASASSATTNLGSTFTYPTASTMSRAGYTFTGWSTSANGTGTIYAAGSAFYPNSDLTYYAVWQSTISYNPTTATSTRAIESTTALTSNAATTLSNGKLIPGTPVSSGLVFNLNAADSSSVVGNTWYDYSRNGISATLGNSPTYNSKEGYFTFNGTNQYATLGNTVLTAVDSTAFSISVMFKADAPMADDKTIIGRYKSAVGGSYIIRQRANVYETWRANTNLTAANAFDEGNINYITMTYNGTVWKMYLNGALTGTVASSGSTGNNVVDLMIAARGDSSSRDTFWAGKIYSAQGYSRAINETEVAYNYQTMFPGQIASKTGFTLVGYNTAADGSGTSYGTTAADISALPTPYARLLPSNYTALTSSTARWTSPVGNSLDVAIQGTPTYNASSGNSWGAAATFPTLSGGTTAGIRLNNPTLTTYTLCVVARYKDVSGAAGSQGRVIGSSNANWISGFHVGYFNRFHHTDGYNYTGVVADLNWHYYCDGGNRAYWDGVKTPSWTNQATTSMPAVAINWSSSGEYSDWEFAEMLIYDQYLPESQIQQIGRYFKNTYGIIQGANTNAAASAAITSDYASPGNVTLYAQWGSTVTYDGNFQSSGSAPSPTLIKGASGALATNSGSLTRKGFRFDGWNTAANGTGKTYAAGSNYLNSGNIVLYAKWSLVTVFPTGVPTSNPTSLQPYMRFEASNYDTSTRTWFDSSGNSRHTSLITGNPTLTTTGSNAYGSNKNFSVVAGSSTTKINFNNVQLTDYTLFNVARYGGSTKARIVQANDNYGLYGFWTGKSGVAWHNGWVTQNSTSLHGDNWVLSTDYYATYRSNGTVRPTINNGETGLRPIGINVNGSEPSDFQIVEVIVYDRQLSLEEIQRVEDYLASTYGLTGYTSPNTSAPSKSYIIGGGAGGGARTETFTATQGLAPYTFSIAPTVSGITLDLSTTNGAAVVVSSLTALGNYTETITVTDATGATTTFPIKLNVAAYTRFDTSTATSITTSYGVSKSLRLNTVQGIGTKVFSFVTNPLNHFTLDTSTAGSGYATLGTTGFVKPGSYTVVVAVTDSTTVRSTYTISITVNQTPLIVYPSGTVPTLRTNNLLVHYDITNALSYSGTETRVADLVGSNIATITSSAPYSSSYGGYLDITPSNYLSMKTCQSSFAGTSMSYFVWINPRGNGVVIDERSSVYSAASMVISGGKLYVGMYGGGAFDYTLPSLNQWYYVGLSYNGTTLKTYVNGKLVGSTASARSQTPIVCLNVGQSTGVGRGSVATGGNFLFGALHAYNTPITDTDVAYNFEATQKNYLVSTAESGEFSINTTAGLASNYSLFTVSLGTGNKTFALTPTVTGITLDTSTVNTAILKLGTNVASTNSTTAALYNETMTATDTVNGVTKYDLRITVNPAIAITASTPLTVSTTVGKTAYDTFTATYGTGNKTFSIVSSAYQSSFVLTSTSSNVAVLTIAPFVPAGTYYETITALDSVGATTSYTLTVIVNPALTIAGSPSNTLTTTVLKASTLRINVLNGTGTKRLTYTSPNPGITIDSSTITSGYATLKVETTTPVNTFTFNVTAIDSMSSTAIGTFTVIVNKWPVIGTPSIVSTNLKVNLSGTSYSGSGEWLDTSGNGKNAKLGASATPAKTNPTYSTNSGGVFSFNETTTATTNYMQIANPGSFETFTVSVWVKFSSIPAAGSGSTACVICENYPGSNAINYYIRFESNQIIAGYRTAATPSTATTGFTPSANTWYNFAFKIYKSGSNYMEELWVNGARPSAAVIGGTGAPLSAGNPINIGKSFNAESYIKGSIGGALIYNRALSDAEIVQNFNAQGSRFLSTTSGTLNYTTTEGKVSSLTSISAADGTAAKTFALAPTISGISLDTSTANSYILNIDSSIAATDSSTARTIYETVTATDGMSAATTLAYKLTINPAIRIAATVDSITTTSGITAWDTFTATYGTGLKTFALTGSPSTNGFTLTQANSQAVLKVEPTANPGTYYETITATDEAGATKSYTITVVIKPGPTMLGPTTLIAAKGVAYRSPVYTVINGNAPFTYTYTSDRRALVPDTNTVTGITFDSATMTLNLASTMASGTYIDTITVTDAKGATTKFAISITIKDPISITGGSLNISKTYGDLYQQTYFINNLTSAVGFRTAVGSTGDVCVPIVGTTDSATFEMLTSVGACNWIAPAGVSAVDYAVAAGGGSGGTGRAGGGGGGGVAIGTGLPVTAGTTYLATVGAGGVATATSTGGNSTFANAAGTTNFISAGGGGRGGSMSTDPVTANGGNGLNAPTATVKSAGGAGGGGSPNFNNGTAYYTEGGASGSGSVTAYKGGNSYRCDGDYGKSDGSVSGSGRTTGGGGGAASAGIGYTTGVTCPTFDAIQKPNGGSAVSTDMTGTTIYLGAGGGGSDGRGPGGQEYLYGSTGRGVGTNGGGNGEQADVPAQGLTPVALSAQPVTSGGDSTGGGGGGGINVGGSGGSGLIVVKYPTQTRVTNTVSLTALSNGSSTTSGSVLLTIPENVQAGSTSKIIKVTNDATTTEYTVNITINKAIPVVTVTLPGNVSSGKYGNSITLSAAVSTEGTVEFKDNGSVISGCSAVQSVTGIATCSWMPTVIATRSITAKLTPTDSTNYDSSTATSSIVVGKADTLTVTAGNESAIYNNGSAITLLRPFTYNGLVSIDTLTAVGMVYTGTANDGTLVNSKTAPTLAGTFIATPDTSVVGISSIINNYLAVALVTGTVTINRATPTLSLIYGGANSVMYAPNLTVDTSTATRSGDGTKSFTSSSLNYCTVDSATAQVSVLKAGSCFITMSVAQSANYLESSLNETLTVTKATRTVVLTSLVSSLKYTETTTVTTTISGGVDDGLISYSLNSNPGCEIDAITGVLRATSGTLLCTLNASIDVGENYESATSTSPLSMTIARANAPVISIDTVTAVDYLPGTRAAISPTYSITGFLGTDAADYLTLTYAFVSNPFESFAYSDTQTPIDAGTYSITPSAIVMRSGIISNYETPTFSSYAINFTINRIEQDSVTITNVNSEVSVPYFLNIAGGNNPGGTVTYNKLEGACTLSTNRLDASTPGLCVVNVTLAGNRNYLPATSDSITVMIRNYTVYQFIADNSSTGITIQHVTPLEKGTVVAPVITLATPDNGRPGDVIVLTGKGFTGLTRVIFNVFTDATTFTVDLDTQITVEIPAGVTPTALDGIDVVAAGGASMRFYDFTILP
jgi:uncharacterized repeat protein (TIGR02543 family)